MVGSPDNRFYQMSEILYEALTVCTENEYYTFAVMEPREDDSASTKKRLTKDLAEINDLVNMDLLKDVSYKYHRQIDNFKEEHGATYKVMELTKIGILMFSNSKSRKVN